MYLNTGSYDGVFNFTVGARLDTVLIAAMTI